MYLQGHSSGACQRPTPVSYAVQLDVSIENASFLLSIIGICNTFGRVAYGWISDQPNVFNLLHYNSNPFCNLIPQFQVNSLLVYNCAISTCGILILITPHLTSYELLVFKSVIFGLTIGIKSFLCVLILATAEILM